MNYYGAIVWSGFWWGEQEFPTLALFESTFDNFSMHYYYNMANWHCLVENAVMLILRHHTERYQSCDNQNE